MDPFFTALLTFLHLFGGTYGEESSGVSWVTVVLVAVALGLGVNALARWNRNG